MKNKDLYLTLSVVSLMIVMTPELVGEEAGSTRSASEQSALAILKNMSAYLANAQRFSVNIHDGYDAVQQSGQKVEFGEIRKVTVQPSRSSAYLRSREAMGRKVWSFSMARN